MKIYQKSIIALFALFIFGCSQMQQEAKNPIEVMKTLSEASKNKDVAEVKNSVSKGTLNLLEEAAKAQNTTVDELLKKENGAPFKELPEMRNEKIEGDAASIEMKNTNSEDWETVPFVKEEGIWKLALDKYLDDFRKRAAESMKMPPTASDSEPNAAQPETGEKPKEEEKKPAKSKK
jgi:hypothetical protein